MQKLNHIIEGRIIEIYCPTDERGHYQVVWDKIPIGYMYIAEPEGYLGSAIWVGSSPYVNLYLDELSRFIESANK